MATASRTKALEVFRAHLDSFCWSVSSSRVKILDAFLRLVTVSGFESVSMRAIAKAVDIKAPSIYSHFPGGKDEILAEALRWYFFQFGTALIDVVEPTRTADEFWDAMIRLHLLRQLQLPESNLWDLLVATDRMVKTLPDGLRHHVDTWVARHEDLYMAAAEDMGVDDARNGVRVVIALFESSTRWNDPVTPGSVPSVAVIDRAVRLSRLLIGAPR